MSATAIRWAPAAWTRLPARSARLRLTLLYSGMFLILGTAIVIVIFLIGSGSGSVATVSRALTSAPGGRAGPVRVAVSQQHNADVNRLLAGAWVTLVLTAAASAVLGWFVAGRVLRPLREMTSATRAISAGNLHLRLALDGPDDEFKQLGDTIDDLLSRLEASFAAQRRFVANAAHELRTPLTVERTLLQVALADRGASAATLRAACEELLVSGRDHERLLDSLLTLATSERGLERREPVDLANVAGSALASRPMEIGPDSLTVTAELKPAVISGDRLLIERLAANLIDNAVDYNEPGGSVTAKTSVQSGRAVLTVANSGPLVAAGEVKRLFEPFRRQQTDRTAADDRHHGLGLSIVRAVATAHGATVTATPRPGGGLVVTVAFPLGA